MTRAASRCLTRTATESLAAPRPWLVAVELLAAIATRPLAAAARGRLPPTDTGLLVEAIGGQAAPSAVRA
ncbi:MAG: hypothetical protein WBL35_00970, partial [Ornithinibacter sp.]